MVRPTAAARRRAPARAREPSGAERRALQLLQHIDVEDGRAGHTETSFKALKARKKSDDEAFHGGGAVLVGYQAGETTQAPPPRFPTALASIVLVFETDPEWQKPDMPEDVWLKTVASSHAKMKKGDEISYAKITMQPILDKLRSSDMIVREVMSKDRKHMFALISVSEKRQRMVAEVMGESMRVRMKVIDDEGNEVKNGGAWTPFVNNLYPYYEKSTEGLLFSSCQQQRIMEFLINEHDVRAMGPQVLQPEACLPGNSILQQLMVEDRVTDWYCLHHPEKKKWLLDYWAGTYVAKQPIEDIREYFGEQIAFFFVFEGHLLKMLWVLAGVGLFTFAMEMQAYAEAGHAQNPYTPLFAIFAAVWSINFATGWKRVEMVYQWEWDLIEYKEPANYRTEFVQNVRTYKRLNRLSQREEYYPDPFFRVLSLLATFAIVSVLIIVTVLATLVVETVTKQLEPVFGGATFVAHILNANVHAVMIVVFREGAKQVMNILNDWENWQTEKQFKNAYVTKMYSYAFLNAYFPIFFVAFMADFWKPFGSDVSCGESCYDYINILVGIIYLQDVIVNYVLRMQKKAKTDEEISQAEQEFMSEKFFGLNETYLEKIIELGYIMMFAALCPLLAFIALLHNLWQLRSHAGNFLEKYQRPLYQCAKDIGSWHLIIDITVILSIIVNSFAIAFQNNAIMHYFPHMNEFDRVFYAMALEHLLLVIKAIADSRVDVPEEVKIAYHIKNYQKSILVDKIDIADPEMNVAFYTDDDGTMFYHKH